MIKNFSKILCVCSFLITVFNCGDDKGPTETKVSTPPADVHENKVPKPPKTSQNPPKKPIAILPKKPIKKNILQKIYNLLPNKKKSKNEIDNKKTEDKVPENEKDIDAKIKESEQTQNLQKNLEKVLNKKPTNKKEEVELKNIKSKISQNLDDNKKEDLDAILNFSLPIHKNSEIRKYASKLNITISNNDTFVNVKNKLIQQALSGNFNNIKKYLKELSKKKPAYEEWVKEILEECSKKLKDVEKENAYKKNLSIIERVGINRNSEEYKNAKKIFLQYYPEKHTKENSYLNLKHDLRLPILQEDPIRKLFAKHRELHIILTEETTYPDLKIKSIDAINNLTKQRKDEIQKDFTNFANANIHYKHFINEILKSISFEVIDKNIVNAEKDVIEFFKKDITDKLLEIKKELKNLDKSDQDVEVTKNLKQIEFFLSETKNNKIHNLENIFNFLEKTIKKYGIESFIFKFLEDKFIYFFFNQTDKKGSTAILNMPPFNIFKYIFNLKIFEFHKNEPFIKDFAKHMNISVDDIEIPFTLAKKLYNSADSFENTKKKLINYKDKSYGPAFYKSWIENLTKELDSFNYVVEGDEEEIHVKKPIITGGLRNIGNSCYFNAALQLLISSQIYDFEIFEKIYKKCDSKGYKDYKDYKLLKDLIKMIEPKKDIISKLFLDILIKRVNSEKYKSETKKSILKILQIKKKTKKYDKAKLLESFKKIENSIAVENKDENYKFLTILIEIATSLLNGKGYGMDSAGHESNNLATLRNSLNSDYASGRQDDSYQAFTYFTQNIEDILFKKTEFKSYDFNVFIKKKELKAIRNNIRKNLPVADGSIVEEISQCLKCGFINLKYAAKEIKYTTVLDFSNYKNDLASIDKNNYEFENLNQSKKIYEDGLILVKSKFNFFCNKCNKVSELIKRKNTIVKNPENLFINLDRFSTADKVNSKYEHLIKYKLKENFGDEEYQLHGVIIHAGSTSGSGHYYSYIKHPIYKYWYEANDSSISQIAINKVLNNPQAIALYYKRKPTYKEKIKKAKKILKTFNKKDYKEYLLTKEKQFKSHEIYQKEDIEDLQLDITFENYMALTLEMEEKKFGKINFLQFIQAEKKRLEN